MHFLLGQDVGQAFRFFGMQGVDGSQVLSQHLAVEEEQSTEGLILGGGGDILVHGQVGEKGLDFWCAHLSRVADVVEVDVALDPVDVGFFGANGAVSPVA